MKYFKQGTGRQGDLVFRKLDITDARFKEITGKASELNTNQYGVKTILVGEGANHHHCIPETHKIEIFKVGGDIVELQEFTTKDAANEVNMWLAKVTAPTELQHYNVETKELTQDHDSIVLDEGYYYFGSQVEFDLDNMIKPVID